MSDYINNHLYIENKDNWKQGTKHFSDDSINSIFDVNNDGEFSAVEKDRAESIVLLNELSSINPIIARAYNDINFQIQTGSFLTKKQIENGKKFYEAIQQAIKIDEENTFVQHHINPEQPNEYLGNIEPDLKDDILHRQFLTQAELDNDP